MSSQLVWDVDTRSLIASMIIVDDPLNANEANSEAARKAAIEFFSKSLITRLNDKAAQPIIVVMQRLHERDLSG